MLQLMDYDTCTVHDINDDVAYTVIHYFEGMQEMEINKNEVSVTNECLSRLDKEEQSKHVVKCQRTKLRLYICGSCVFSAIILSLHSLIKDIFYKKEIF